MRYNLYSFRLIACILLQLAWYFVYSQESYINHQGKTIETRFMLPRGFERMQIKSESFGDYLRKLPLKPVGTKVKYYDGSIKENYDVYNSVVDLPIGNKNLHQCADAIIRLKAEYHRKRGEYDQIHFNFTNGMRVDYSEWMKGRRIQIEGNKTWWVSEETASNTYDDFWNYLEQIFTYAGTYSLKKELVAVSINDILAGDVFIFNPGIGKLGHAVLVLDIAISKTTNERLYLLGQSFMPAQEFHILKNAESQKYGPWYSNILPDGVFRTPEWTFYENELKRFQK